MASRAQVQSMNDRLRHFSQNTIKLSKIRSDEGHKTGHEVFTLLKNNSKFNIGRTVIGGSAAKGTAIIGSDFDLVVFVNYQPSFQLVLNDFEQILKKRYKNVTKTTHTIALEVNGMNFDVVPAPNFVEHTHKLSSAEVVHQQTVSTLTYMKSIIGKDSRLWYQYRQYAPGLVEATIAFMDDAKQTGFPCDIIRLAKYWLTKLHMGHGYIPGKKLTIEIIALDAAKEAMKDPGSFPYVRALTGFFERIMDFENLNIRVARGRSGFRSPKGLRSQHPKIMDPVNPYNNLAKPWERHRRQMDALKKFAEKSLRDLENGNFKSLFEDQGL